MIKWQKLSSYTTEINETLPAYVLYLVGNIKVQKSTLAVATNQKPNHSLTKELYHQCRKQYYRLCHQEDHQSIKQISMRWQWTLGSNTKTIRKNKPPHFKQNMKFPWKFKQSLSPTFQWLPSNRSSYRLKCWFWAQKWPISTIWT